MAEPKITITAVDQTKAAFESAKRNMAELGDKASWIKDRLGSIGVALGAAFTAGSIMHLVDMLDSLDKLSEKTGITVESLSALRYASETVDVSQETMSKGLARLAKLMGEAAGGNDQAVETFRALGISILDGNGKLRDINSVFTETAQRFSGYEDGAGKAALAMRVFGKSGSDLIPLLNLGQSGLQSMASEAQALGAIYGGDVIKNATEFNDNLKKIKMASEAAAVSLSGPLVAALADASSGFLEAKKSGEGYLGMLARIAFKLPELEGGMRFSGMIPGARFVGMLQQYGKVIANDVERFGDRGGSAVRVKTEAPVVGDKTKIKIPDHYADNFINQLITEYAALAGNMNKTDEVTRKLDTATEKFTLSQRAAAIGLAGQIDKQKELTDAVNEAARYQGAVLEGQLKAEEGHYAAVGSLEKLAQEQALELSLLGKMPEAIAAERFERELSNQERIAEAALVERGMQNGWNEIRMAEERAKIARESADARSSFGRIQIDQLDQKYNPLRGMQDGITEYMDGVARAGDYAKNVWVKGLGSMEDAMTNFVQTGKLDFSSLANSIISDLIRIQVRQSITGPLGNWMQGLSLFGGSGGMGSTAGAFNGTMNNPSAFVAMTPLATGMDYVPYDNFPALLHRGERVVPAAQNNGSEASTVININVTVGDVAGKSDVVAGMQTVKAQILSQLYRGSRYGGAIA